MGNNGRRQVTSTARLMKKVFCLTLLILVCCGMPIQAEEVFDPQGTPLRKLERGGANALLGGLEFLYRLRQPDNGANVPPWITGIGASIYYTCKRSLIGLYEVVTFPFPLPADYVPVMKPEFVWQYPPKKK